MIRIPSRIVSTLLALLIVASCSGRETDEPETTWRGDTGSGSDTTRTLDSSQDPGTGTGEDATQGETSTTGLTVRDLQDEGSVNHPAPDSDIVVTAVVTAVDTYAYEDNPATIGTFWIQDAVGGSYSGIEVFNDDNGIDVSGLVVGQTVTVTGQYIEFEGLSEIRLASFEVTDTTASPLAPTSVDPAKVATDQEQAEEYEGVLVIIRDVTVTDNGIGYGKIVVTGGLEIDDELVSFGTTPAVGQSYESITGVLTYHFDAVQLFPRTAADLVTDSGGGGGSDAESLAELHESPPANDAQVDLSGLVVTAVVEDLDGNKSAFVQDPDDGDDDTLEYGMWLGSRSYTVYTGISDLLDLVPGDEVHVVGPFKAGRFGGNLLEIRLESIERTNTGQTYTIHDIADPTTIARPGTTGTDDREGLLVRLTDVTVDAFVVDEFGILIPVVVEGSGEATTALVLDVTRIYSTVGELPSALAGGGTVTVTGPLWYRRTADIDLDTEGDQTWDAQRILVLDEDDIDAD